MYLTQMYRIEVDGHIVITGQLPTGATILETLSILNAEDGYDLIRIADNENMGVNLWLKEGDSRDNYREEEHEEPTPEQS